MKSCRMKMASSDPFFIIFCRWEIPDSRNAIIVKRENFIRAMIIVRCLYIKMVDLMWFHQASNFRWRTKSQCPNNHHFGSAAKQQRRKPLITIWYTFGTAVSSHFTTTPSKHNCFHVIIPIRFLCTYFTTCNFRCSRPSDCLLLLVFVRIHSPSIDCDPHWLTNGHRQQS